MSADPMGPVYKRGDAKGQSGSLFACTGSGEHRARSADILVHGLVAECLASYGTALAGVLNI